jgi:hypothetical protein
LSLSLAVLSDRVSRPSADFSALLASSHSGGPLTNLSTSPSRCPSRLVCIPAGPCSLRRSMPSIVHIWHDWQTFPPLSTSSGFGGPPPSCSFSLHHRPWQCLAGGPGVASFGPCGCPSSSCTSSRSRLMAFSHRGTWRTSSTDLPPLSLSPTPHPIPASQVGPRVLSAILAFGALLSSLLSLSG